ncbi:helix-turn-helix domain-containing protein [Nannocystis radixulma]|uniref:Helix-turn-helix domain-containing protein n=1 Tax=Nannocystis radixulma TaxID=2995305 RepID=A0ABT5BA95_9BACT|nr:helix-turn-helix domain-containing protein [Nannocystis radixulma]MDC0670540.1 helix-turn-helix domain-containing protein [Nannocystis radixulma]
MSRKPEVTPVLGSRLRQLCGERGLSCSELARRSGLGVGVVRRILNAGRPVQPAERRSLARALRVKIRDLIALEAPPGLAAVAETPRGRLERERDDLLAQVEQLQDALTAERVARAAEIAELRDQHMRELALLRSGFHEEQVKALGEAQEREEKLAAALNVALDAIDRLGDGTPPAPAHASGAQPSSVVETLAGVAAGIGGLALTTVLLRAKRC